MHHTPIRPSWRLRPAGPRGPTLRLEYTAAGSAAIDNSTIVIKAVMIGTPAMQQMEMVARSHHVGGPRFWPLLGCARHAQTGPSAVKVCVCYISRTRSWVKPTIWLPSPPIVLTTHAGAQLQNKSSRGHYALLITFWTEVVLNCRCEQMPSQVKCHKGCVAVRTRDAPTSLGLLRTVGADVPLQA